MNRLSFLLIFFSLSLNCVNGQQSFSTRLSIKNIVYLEALGAGILGSINYERRLTREPEISARIGLGFYTESAIYMTYPTSLHYIIPLKENRFIEVGPGYTFAQYGTDDCFDCREQVTGENLNSLFFSIGYRRIFHPNLMWKVNFTPLISNNQSAKFTPWLGISLGKYF